MNHSIHHVALQAIRICSSDALDLDMEEDTTMTAQVDCTLYSIPDLCGIFSNSCTHYFRNAEQMVDCPEVKLHIRVAS